MFKLNASGVVLVVGLGLATAVAQRAKIGSERAVETHLEDGQEFTTPLADFVAYGKTLFAANWTEDDGAGRPLTNGRGLPLADRTRPLAGSAAFNRLSGPDANSCHGCHRQPFGAPGGSGDFVANVFQGAERFDFATFDRTDKTKLRGSVDEQGRPVMLATIGNSRATPDLNGAGYLEMLAREMTAELQRVRDRIQLGGANALIAKGVSFGTLARRRNGSWDTTGVEGLPPQSLAVSKATPEPSLVVRPWQRSGTSVSIREITIASFNQNLGMQPTERFGVGADPDGDGVVNELTRADITAISAFVATLPVPGRVVPRSAQAERAIEVGERLFDELRCTTCHVPSLPLTRSGWVYREPGPYIPVWAKSRSPLRTLNLDLTSPVLPLPRLTFSQAEPDVIRVPAYTDFKLHDITDAADPTAAEALDLNQPTSSPNFAAGNRRFLTRRLWGVGNQPPYFHDGRFTNLRQAIIAHAGEALEQRIAFEAAPKHSQEAVLEFLASLQVLPPGTLSTIVDENFRPRKWPR